MFPWLDANNSPEQVQSRYTYKQQQDLIGAAYNNKTSPAGVGYPIDMRGNEMRQNAGQRYKADYAAFYRNNVSEYQKHTNMSPDERKLKLQTPSENETVGGLVERMAVSKRLLFSSHQQKAQFAFDNNTQVAQDKGSPQSMSIKFSQPRQQQQSMNQSSTNAELVQEVNPYDNMIGKREGTQAAVVAKPAEVYRSAKPQQQPAFRFGDMSNRGQRNATDEEMNGGGRYGNRVGERNMMDEMYEREQREAELKRMKRADYYRSLESDRLEVKNSERTGGIVDGRKSSRSRGEQQSQQVGAVIVPLKGEDRQFAWKTQDKSLNEQIGDNYFKKQERKAIETAGFADQLQQQINEKKREKQLEKEKQEMLDRQYEAKIRQEVEQLKAKYELEMQGKQHEIKTLKKNVEKKKADEIQMKAESKLSRTPLVREDSPGKASANSSPHLQAQVQQPPIVDDFKQSEWKVTKPNQEETVLALAPAHQESSAYPVVNRSQTIPASSSSHLQFNLNTSTNEKNSYDQQPYRRAQRPPHLEELDKLQDELARRQQFDLQYHQQMQALKPYYQESHTQQLRDRKIDEELQQLRTQLTLQTNLLQSGVQRIKLDEKNALDLKSSALHDLESLKESLFKQNQQESLKLRDLQSSLGNLAYVQTDFLPQSSSAYSLKAPSKAMPGLLSLSSNYYPIKPTNPSSSLSSTSALNFQLEKRLNTINLNKGEIQLLEVDNLLSNLRQGVY